MQSILGIGGVFIRANDPERLLHWYQRVLGLPLGEYGAWEPAAGTSTFAVFPHDSDYFGNAQQQVMLNFRVRDLDALLAALREHGAETSDEVQTMDGIGRFSWVTDPEGNRVELWEATS